MVLGSRRFVVAMMLLCLAQKFCQRRDVRIAESASGQPLGDLLKQPGVAVWVIECGKGKVATVIGCQPADAPVAVGPELRPGSCRVEDFTDFDTTTDESLARSLDIGNDEVKALGGTRRGRSHLDAELHGAPRPWRRELHDPETVVEWKIGVEPPSEL